MLRRCQRLIDLFEAFLILKHRELHIMSALIDALTRQSASLDALATAIANIPPPVDESAVAAQINANSDKIDADTALLTTPAA